MSRFRAAFPTRHVILPIINVSSLEQAQENVRIARAAGADGSFLISLGPVSDETLLEIHRTLLVREPGY